MRHYAVLIIFHVSTVHTLTINFVLPYALTVSGCLCTMNNETKYSFVTDSLSSHQIRSLQPHNRFCHFNMDGRKENNKWMPSHLTGDISKGWSSSVVTIMSWLMMVACYSTVCPMSVCQITIWAADSANYYFLFWQLHPLSSLTFPPFDC